MPRTARLTPANMVFHIYNRGVGRMRLFGKPDEYATFEEVMTRTLQTCPIRICSYCLLPQQWHLILWPEREGELAAFMQKLTITHVRVWQENRRLVGTGHVYQGRYKSFPVEAAAPFYQVVRYVESSPVRSKLVFQADEWQWSSLWRREHGTTDDRRILSKWPVPRSRKWRELVAEPLSKPDLRDLDLALKRGRPYGCEEWVSQTVKKLGLESTMRSRGRPRKRA